MGDPMRAAATAMRGGPGGGPHAPAPAPAPPATKRRQHCTFCKNHGVIQRKNGHVCEHKDCKCLLCQLTTFAQMAMRHQQAWWRHQGREMAKNKNLQVLGFSSRQLCDKCRNHNEFFKKRGHKTNCKYEACSCRLCDLTDKRRLVMKHQQRVRRANVTSHEEPASDDDDADGNNNQSSSREETDLSQEQENNYEEGTNEHAIVEAINAVTKAIHALPDTSSGMSSFSSRAAASARARQSSKSSAASCRPPPPPPTTLRHPPPSSSSMPLDYPHPAIPIETAQHHQQRRSPPTPSYPQQPSNGFPSFPPSPAEERALISGSVQNSRPWERDRVSPPSPSASLHQKPKFSPYTPRTTSPPKGLSCEPATITIKQEVKDEAPWSPVEADMASMPSPSSGLMGQQRPSYLSNFPTSLGPNSISAMSPPGMNNVAPLHQKQSPLNPFYSSLTNLEKAGGFNPNPASHVTISQFEGSVSNNRMEEESEAASSVRLMRSEVGDSSGPSSGLSTYGSGYVPTSNGNTLLQRAASDSEFSLSRGMPPGALEGLHLITKMVERRFPEHFQATSEGSGYYPPPQSGSAAHQPIPGFFRSHPPGVLNHHSSVLHNPVQQPCPVRLFPANFQWNRGFLPGYHGPFSMLNPDPFLSSYSSALLSRPNRNS